MRSLIIATMLCLCSAPAFACMYDTDCETGNVCITGACTPVHSTNDDNDAPAKRVTKGKTCYGDGDCEEGSRCIRGTGPEGVCLGR